MLPPRDAAAGPNPLLKRLPLLILIAAGVFLYQSSLFPQTRKLIWQSGPSRAEIREVDLQIWSPGGELLKRELLTFAAGAPAELHQELTLREGVYQARYVIEREGAAQEAGMRLVEVKAEETYYLPLGRN